MPAAIPKATPNTRNTRTVPNCRSIHSPMSPGTTISREIVVASELHSAARARGERSSGGSATSPASIGSGWVGEAHGRDYGARASVPAVTNARASAETRDSIPRAHDRNTANPTWVRQNTSSYQSGHQVSSDACSLTPLLSSSSLLSCISCRDAGGGTHLRCVGVKRGGRHGVADDAGKMTDRGRTGRIRTVPQEPLGANTSSELMPCPAKWVFTLLGRIWILPGRFFLTPCQQRQYGGGVLGGLDSLERPLIAFDRYPNYNRCYRSFLSRPGLRLGPCQRQETSMGQRGSGILEPTDGREQRRQWPGTRLPVLLRCRDRGGKRCPVLEARGQGWPNGKGR